MGDTVRSYPTDELEVRWSATRCIHVRACVHGLPAVFDAGRRPWIEPHRASADAIAEVVARCPTGALHVVRKDGAEAEPVPAENTVTVARDGPLYLRGAIRLDGVDGEGKLEDTRVALCRCGASEHKPLCDGSHARVGFRDPGALAPRLLGDAPAADGRLRVSAIANGPLRLQGPMSLRAEGGGAVYRGSGGELCRCGASGHKPFCDGSHARVGFGGGRSGGDA